MGFDYILAYAFTFLLLVGKPPSTNGYFSIYMARRAKNLVEVAGYRDAILFSEQLTLFQSSLLQRLLAGLSMCLRNFAQMWW